MTFEELQLNSKFVIDTPKSKGTVYRKIEHRDREKHLGIFMLDESTGKFYQPTTSPIKEYHE